VKRTLPRELKVLEVEKGHMGMPMLALSWCILACQDTRVGVLASLWAMPTTSSTAKLAQWFSRTHLLMFSPCSYDPKEGKHSGRQPNVGPTKVRIQLREPAMGNGVLIDPERLTTGQVIAWIVAPSAGAGTPLALHSKGFLLLCRTGLGSCDWSVTVACGFQDTESIPLLLAVD